MRAKFKTGKLRRSLPGLLKLLNENSLLNIERVIYIQSHKDHLILTTTDMKKSLVVTVDAEIENGKDFVLPINLSHLLTKGEEVELFVIKGKLRVNDEVYDLPDLREYYFIKP